MSKAAESQVQRTRGLPARSRWLTACDVLVAEASGSSYGVGFEVGYVLGRASASGQRVSCSTMPRVATSVSRLITGNDDAACTTFGYGSIEELTAFIDRRSANASSVAAGSLVACDLADEMPRARYGRGASNRATIRPLTATSPPVSFRCRDPRCRRRRLRRRDPHAADSHRAADRRQRRAPRSISSSRRCSRSARSKSAAPTTSSAS